MSVNKYPFVPNLVKMGGTGVIFFYFSPKQRLRTQNQCLKQKYLNKIFLFFFRMKFSILPVEKDLCILHEHIFVLEPCR